MTDPAPAGADSEPRDGPPRILLIGALVVAVAAIIAVLVIAAHRQTPEQPVAIAAVPAPQAADPACHTLLDALPQRLGDYERASAVDPVPPGAAAWRAKSAGDAVILRCGLDRPAEFVVGSPIQMVDEVAWFKISDLGNSDGGQERSDPGLGSGARTTWVAVDRPVYVALTLPQNSGPTPIQELSKLVSRSMPATPIRPAQAG
jgi:Protein of unknown function (DUF3515)